MGLHKRTFKRKRPDGTEYAYVSPHWSYSFRHPATGKWVYGSTNTRDESAARMLLDRARGEAEEEADGIRRPYKRHVNRPLIEHVDEWAATLAAKGLTDSYVEGVKGKARAVIQGCKFRTWLDVSASRVQRYIGELRARDRQLRGRKLKGGGRAVRGCGPKTRNDYLKSSKQFLAWMVADRRAPENPIEYLSGENVRTDRRHERRAFEIDELRLLLEATWEGPERFGMGAADRYWLYRVAVETGLRLSELGSLTPASFDLTADPPAVTVEAAYTKNRREDTLPLRPATAGELAPWLDARDTDDRMLYELPHRSNVVRMYREDLAAARAAWIAAAKGRERSRRKASSFLAYRDAAGRYADFHGLRHTFITNLGRGGVAPKVAQDLARHSDINLTLSVYSHTILEDRATALEALPDLGPRRRSDAAAGVA